MDEKVFRDYVGQAGLLYESFKRAKEGNDDRRPSSSRASGADNEVIPLAGQRRLPSSPNLSRTESSSSVTSVDYANKRRSIGGPSRRAGPSVAPLSTIPNVYFEEDFKLENPRTFDVVSERAEIVRQPIGANGSAVPPGGTGKKALAANAILQEKLSWYMDTVEIHLISSISTASTSFFAALGSLRELHAEAEESVGRIKALREDLEKLDENMAVGGLKIVAMKQRRENVRKLGEAIRQLEAVVLAMGECEDQVNNDEIEEALKGLTDVERLMSGDAADVLHKSQSQKPLAYSGSMIDLRRIKALEGASSDIAFLRKRIGKAYEAKFLETLLGDLRTHADAVSFNSTFQRWNKASSRLRGQHIRTPSELPAYMHVDGSFRTILLTQLKGLARSESIMTAAVTYREAILREFKNLIRRHLPSSSDDDAESTTSIMTQGSAHLSQQEKSSILARNLRALDAEDAEMMFKKIYANVGEALRRLSTQVKVILDITSSLGSPRLNVPLKSPSTPAIGSPQFATVNGLLSAEPSPGPPPALVRQDEIQQALDLSSLLGQAVDIALVQIVKILRVRTEQTTHLDMPFFLRYFTLNRLFADECEAISGRGGDSLKTLVNDHISTFLNLTTEAEKQRLVQTMDADKWEARDFTDEDSKRLDLIITASTQVIEAWTKVSWIWDEESVLGHERSLNGIVNGIKNGDGHPGETKDANESKATKEKARGAVLEEETYVIPASAIAVLRGVEVFEQLLQGIPVSVDISSALLDYLKLYNSRSSQLILGAGATKSAGLKNITTRHLALSSQALNFITAVIPYIREFARRYLPNSSSIMVEFDDVKRRLQEHRVGISDKLVDIMTGRATAHVNKMKDVNWDTASDGVNSYMETLIKETTTLHKVLTRHLPESNVRMIMDPVLADYRKQWGKAFDNAVVKSETAKEKHVYSPSSLRISANMGLASFATPSISEFVSIR